MKGFVCKEVEGLDLHYKDNDDDNDDCEDDDDDNDDDEDKRGVKRGTILTLTVKHRLIAGYL